MNVSDLFIIEIFQNKKNVFLFQLKDGTITVTKAICFQDSIFIKLFFFVVHLKSGQVLVVRLNDA